MRSVRAIVVNGPGRSAKLSIRAVRPVRNTIELIVFPSGSSARFHLVPTGKLSSEIEEAATKVIESSES